MPQTKTCQNCKSNFTISQDDEAFYKKLKVPPPTFCTRCRQQRRLSWRNEINLFNAKCAKTGANMLSMYDPKAGYTVYDQTEWWKDDWDPIKYGRDFDFNRTFFEQLYELQKVVPRMSLNVMYNENSEYTNYAYNNKNSYLVMTADYNEDSYYGRFSQRNFRCVDFDFTYDSRVCYQTIDTHKSEHCMYCQMIENSSELYFCYDMKNCHDCIFCGGLRNQNSMIFNKKVTKEEFKKFKDEMKMDTKEGVAVAWQKAKEFWQTIPHKYLQVVQCEDCAGDHLKNSKNAILCFDSKDLHDVKYASQLEEVKDSYDWDFFGHGELCYEMASCAYQLFNCRFCMNTWVGGSDMTYCDMCLGNEHLFGCVGLRKRKYCILNKQYSEEDYENLEQKIIEHMKKTGEWGEFMPAKYSPFEYKDSVASEYFPLAKEEQTKKEQKPENIKEGIYVCQTCKKNFKILEQEVKFYKEFKIPTPNDCWLCRHKKRMLLRNPRILYKRICDNCKEPINTTYTPENKVKVYCEKCYIDAIN